MQIFTLFFLFFTLVSIKNQQKYRKQYKNIKNNFLGNQKLSDGSLLCISTSVLLSRILNGYSLKYTLR